MTYFLKGVKLVSITVVVENEKTAKYFSYFFVFPTAASVVSEEGIFSGKIVIKSKNSQFKVTLPYHAQVLRGQLQVNESSTHFHLETEEMNTEIVR